MTDSQGTKWESEIRSRAQARGFNADRYPKRGQGGEPDVWIEPNYSRPQPRYIGIVAWKRLVGKRSGPQRRKPDGERDTVTLALDDFLDLLEYVDDGVRVEVQAKWKAALNVTRTLGELRDWIKEYR